MDKRISRIWPLVRQAFNGAVDRRCEPRGEPVMELYFREISPDNDAGEGYFRKHHDKN